MYLSAFLVIMASDLVTICIAEKTVQQAWNEEYGELADQISNPSNWIKVSPERIAAETLDKQALVLSSDKDPLDIVLRRTNALFDNLKDSGQISQLTLNNFLMQLDELSAGAQSASNINARKDLYIRVCSLRREIAFANPLFDFDSVICMLENPGPNRAVEQARAVHGHTNGGGPVIIHNIKTKPLTVMPLADVKVDSGLWQGKEIAGKFSGLELTYGGDEILFSATTDSEIWRIFRFNLETKKLAQLTDGTYDDFDPYELPSGRVLFTSTRIRGMGRCVLIPHSLTYTLHSMDADGSDLIPLSYHETNEWQPSVDNEGMIIYTRWDYIDRHWGTAHHLWRCSPDGTDPRSPHGNYPLPHSVMPAGVGPEQYGKTMVAGFDSKYGRNFRPDMEMSFRCIPNSHKLTATAVGHHEGFSGTLILVDTRVEDDGRMSQVKRITPQYAFPEVEGGPRNAYGTAWPLSEDFYLCNFQSGLYLLDRFGNRELIYDPQSGPFRLRDPFPLRQRQKPHVIADKTWQGKRASLPDHRRAVISVMNVYNTDELGKLPEGITIRWLRIIQVMPQLYIKECCSNESVRMIGFASDSIGRIPLGVVPVEEDGSVYFEAPVGKPIYFQLLDEKGVAIQSMRSATWVHPGEHLSCVGCHEGKAQTPPSHIYPIAMKRSPSKILPELETGTVPFNYYRLVKEPVFDNKCVGCHKDHPGAPDMTYKSLAKHSLAFAYVGEEGLNLLGVGGSRTTPGKFGARASGIMKSLATKDYHKDIQLTEEEHLRLVMWLDLNSNEICWLSDDMAQIEAQKRGEVVWPPKWVIDPDNIMAVERDYPLPGESAGLVVRRLGL